MSRISLDELMTRLSDLSLDESELAPYFEIDPDAEDAFAPAFRLNPRTVKLPPGPEAAARSAMALNMANWWCRMQRQAEFMERMKQGYSGPVIVAEGDSWWQYPLLLHDTIDHLMKSHAVWCVSAAGDLLGEMGAKAEYVAALQSTNADILLFSGGGNDLLAGGNLAKHLENFDAALKPADYLKSTFDQVLTRAFGDYERILRDVHGRFPAVRVLVHGYDYALPKGGRWLGKPMASRGINDRALQAQIAAEIMDRFNRGLRRLVATMPHVSYLDLRGKVGPARWHDELHPTNEGYGAVAEAFRQKIVELANAPRAPRVFAPGGPFGAPAALERSMRGAVSVAEAPRPGTRAVSLHIGLNTVDPLHYAGWDGALSGCENDAIAMERLARSLGYEPRILLTEAATRQSVINIVADYARSLQAGDMFLLTVAGHGGRIPDWNRDEPDDGTRTAMDSTLCLFDSQLVDDELFHLWAEFAEGVRIVIVGDTCHSGTQVRVTPFSGPDTGIRPRVMPNLVATRTWQQNLEEYQSRTSSLDQIDRRILLDPLTRVVKADIIGLGACQDHQYAYDGDEHGVFTAALLQVWDSGRFDGDYAGLRTAIDREIGMQQQVPNLDLQLTRDPGFALQVPFAPWPHLRQASPAGSSAEDEPDDAPPEDPAGTDPDRLGATARSLTGWADWSDFQVHVQAIGLEHFGASEFLILGGNHANPNSKGHGLNTYPPRSLWPNITATAKVLDRLRERLGVPIRITNAYRSKAYNAAITGEPGSLHTRFNALDFGASGVSPARVGAFLMWMRDKEKLFTGGIGVYPTFVHVDTRGSNATWAGTGATVPAVPASNPIG